MTENLLALSDGAMLAYSDIGEGRPIVLLHGVCMSRVFFERNIEALAQRHRVIAVDFRGHGESPAVEGGHTVAQYARDVEELLAHLHLTDVTAVGWSMGNLVLWDYLKQFGDERISSVVIISQGPSDLTQPGWPYGIADITELGEFVAAMQADFRGFFADFATQMFKDEPTPEQLQRFVDAICKMGTNAGTVILVDQTLQDFRDVIPAFTTPHLLVWGSDEKVIKQASGDWLASALPNAQLELFAESGHCPMWEEAERFNQLVVDWVAQH